MIYRIDHIPADTMLHRRPGHQMEPTTITIHNTSNPASTAAGERGWLTNPANNRVASFHIVVDEHEAIECIPLNENAWHAGDGDGDGNRASIGIELCESGDYAQTVKNAVQLVASMLRDRGWGVDRLRRHYDWSGKICPRLMYGDGTWAGWHAFVDRVAAALNPPVQPGAMSQEDANKIIKFLSAGWYATENEEARAEFNRLANELRKASGQPMQ